MWSSLDYAGFAQLCGRSPIIRCIPQSRSPIPSTPAVLEAPLPAMLMSAGGDGVRHRPGTAPGPAGDRPYLPLRAPAGDPTPITQGDIDYRFLTFQTGSRFQNRLPVFRFPFNISSADP